MTRFLLTTSVAMLVTGGALSAAVVTFSGDTTGQPTFYRTTETGYESSQDVPFSVYNITVDTSGSYVFGVVSDGSPGFDSFISLYEGALDPLDSETRWLISNDDATSNFADGSAFSFNLNAGENYAFVVTGFLGALDPDEGAFTATISGPGRATAAAVPDTGSALSGLLSAGLGFAFCLRSKNWRNRNSR